MTINWNKKSKIQNIVQVFNRLSWVIQLTSNVDNLNQ